MSNQSDDMFMFCGGRDKSGMPKKDQNKYQDKNISEIMFVNNYIQNGVGQANV